jgi:GT2 family glycosyltransferase
VKIELKADEAEQIKREAQIFANPDLKAVYAELVLDSLAKIDGKEAFVLLGKTADGKNEKLYFDVSGGFLIRRTASTPTVLGEFVYQVDYADYKNFGGVKLPTTIKFAVPNIYWTRKVLSVKNNVMIEDETFVVRR